MSKERASRSWGVDKAAVFSVCHAFMPYESFITGFYGNPLKEPPQGVHETYPIEAHGGPLRPIEAN